MDEVNNEKVEQGINKKDRFIIARHCKGVFVDLQTSFSKIVSKLDDIIKEPLTIYDLVHIYIICDRIQTTLYNLKCYINIDILHCYRNISITSFLDTEGIATEKDLDVLKIFSEKIEAYNHILSMENSTTNVSDKYFNNLIYKLFHGDSNGYCINACVTLVTDIANKLDEKVDEIAKTIEVRVKLPDTDE